MVLTEAQKLAKKKYIESHGDCSKIYHKKRYETDSEYREYKKKKALERYYRLKQQINN